MKIEDIDVGSNNFNQTFKSLFDGFNSSLGKGRLNNIPNSDNVVITLGNPSGNRTLLLCMQSRLTGLEKMLLLLIQRN